MISSTLFRTLVFTFVAGSLFSHAFVSSPRTIRGNNVMTFGAPTCSRSTELFAKKKRRRRKEESETSGTGSSIGSSDDFPGFDVDDDGSLPDFDLGDDEEATDSKSSKKSGTAKANFEEITDAMMGDASTPTRSLDDLISDRSLESKFEFDGEDEDISIPDFTTIAKAGGAPSELEVGKKKARQASRRAAAIDAKESAVEEKLDIPFLQDEKGKISPIKILETGAWLGIFLLVGWEFYLNSPFFERSAPMAPVVFEILM